MQDDTNDYPLEMRLLARRSGIPVHDVALLAREGLLHTLHDNRGRVTPKQARAVLDGWRTLWEAQDHGDERQVRHNAQAARRPAAPQTPQPPKRYGPRVRHVYDDVEDRRLR